MLYKQRIKNAEILDTAEAFYSKKNTGLVDDHRNGQRREEERYAETKWKRSA
jgi:hypothetical protein